MSGTEAYLQAGWKFSRDAARASAAETLAKPSIKAHVAGLRKNQTRKALLTKDRQREILRDMAEDPSAKPLVRIRAIELDAKLAGHFAPDQVVIENIPSKLQSICKRANHAASLLDISARLRPKAQAAAVKDGGHANGDDPVTTIALSRWPT